MAAPQIIQFTSLQTGVTSVTKTLTATYNVKNTITKTLSPSYTVKNVITKTLSPSYTVRAAPIKTLTPSYKVIQRISKTLTASYTVFARPVWTVNPVISGAPLSGQLLTVDHGTQTNMIALMAPLTYAVRWEVETAPGSGVFTPLTGETADTLQL